MKPYALPTLFKDLPPAALSRLLAAARRRRFTAGETVVGEGTTPAAVYVIEHGTASVWAADWQGREQRMGLIGPGETVGETSLFTGQPSPITVRALTDLEALVVGDAELHRAAAAHPEVYRKVGAIVSRRLEQVSRQTAERPRGGLTVLSERGAPPLLAYALACSVAWHTRRPTILVALTEGTVSTPLAGLATAVPAARTVGGSSGAHLMVLGATVAGLEALPATLAELCRQYDHVLVAGPSEVTELPDLIGATGPSGTERSHRAAHRVVMAGTQPPPGTPAGGRPGHTICGWTGAGRWARPDADGVLRVPALRAADEEALGKGLLPPGTPAGAALGWAARDLAGLKVGVAFGSGGARGFAHVGVLRALERLGVTADFVAGTSVGAGVAALYAMGYDANGVLETLLDVGTSGFRLDPRSTGLLSDTVLREHLRALGGEKNIEDLRIPLGVVAADLVSGQEVVFRSGPIGPAVLASMSIPGLFPAQCMGPYTLVDGAVLNPLPSGVVSEMGADRVIAVKLSAGASRTTAEAHRGGGRRPPSALEVMTRTIGLMQSNAAADPDQGALVIAPDFGDGPAISLRRFLAGRRYVELGEAAADAVMPELAAALPWVRGAATCP
jgi:NTE family protein